MFLNNELILNSDMGRQSYQDQILGLHNFLENAGVHDKLALNDSQASSLFTQQAWLDISRQVVDLRQRVKGFDIVADLDSRIRPADIGDFAVTYQQLNGMSDNSSVSIDGRDNQAYDHVSYNEDGDPIVVFKNGWGISWRKKAMFDKFVDIMLDSSRGAMHHYNQRVVDYYLNGDANIQFGKYKGEGLLTHRNTLKVDLGQGGDFKINLATATPTQLSAFFKNLTKVMADNFIYSFDVLWVSQDVWANLAQAYALVGDAQAGAAPNASVLDYLMKFIPAREVKPTYGLEGNQFLGINRDMVTKRVAMPATITALPRTKPQSDYLFEVLSVEGLSVEADAVGHKGVFFGSDITTAVA